MKKSWFPIALILLLAGQAFSQDNTAWQADLEVRIKNLSEQLTQLNDAIADTSRASEPFDEVFLNKIYELQGQLQDVSYKVYERTTFVETPSVEDSIATWDIPTDEDTPSSGNNFPGFKANKSPRTILRLGLGFGFSDLADLSDLSTGTVVPNIETRKSGFLSWQFLVETRLGKRDTESLSTGGFNPKKPWKRNDQFKNNRISMVYGLSIDRNRLVDNGGAVMTTNDRGEGSFVNFTGVPKRNEIVINSINIPVMLQLRAGKDFMLRAGVFGGMRTGARQTITYSESDFEFERIRRANFDLAKYTYGIVAGLGWDGLYFSGKFHLNPWFKKSKEYDLRLASIGLTLSM